MWCRNIEADILEGSPEIHASCSANSVFQRVRLHTYERDGFSNEVFSFSSNTSSCVRYATSRTPSTIIGRLYCIQEALRVTSSIECSDQPTIAVVGGDDVAYLLKSDNPSTVCEALKIRRTQAIMWSGAVDGSEGAISARIWWKTMTTHLSELAFIEGVIFGGVPEPSMWPKLAVVVAPLKIELVPSCPCRIVFVAPRTSKSVMWCWSRDLTQTVNDSIPFYPGGQRLLTCPFQRQPEVDHRDEDDRDLYMIGGCDLGTHVDSPSHFYADACSITDIPASNLVVPIFVVDCRQQCAINPDYTLSVDDLIAFESELGFEISRQSLICMWTGWGSKFTDVAAYQNFGSDKKMHFPGFSASAAEFVVKQRDCAGIGIDTLSLDAGTSEDFPVHQIVLGAGRYQVENMLFPPVAVDWRNSVAVVLPIRVHGAFEAMARVSVLDLRVEERSR